jgi:hypothetical protein
MASSTALAAATLAALGMLGCDGAGRSSSATVEQATDTALCDLVAENATSTLICPAGQTIASVAFASYGTPGGTCPAFTTGACQAAGSSSIVQTACLGRVSCAVSANNATFGDPCSGTPKRLAVQVICSSGSSASSNPKINFQLAGSEVPAGYLPDTGDLYGPRTGGATYGWNISQTDVTRQRNINSDPRLDTLVQLHPASVWEIALPSGTYSVQVTIGDPGFPSVHTLRVEGIVYWSGLALDSNQFATLTRTVTVSDGRLTLDNAGAADKATRVTYLEVTAVGGGGGTGGATMMGTGGTTGTGGAAMMGTGGAAMMGTGGAATMGTGGAATMGTGGSGGTGGGAITAVTTNRYDDQRSGVNLRETVLTPSNVASGRFGRLFSRAVDGQIYAQPLYLAGVTAPDNRVHDLVYVATAHNSVYAFDAADPAASTPLWQRNLGPSGSTSSFGCTDMIPEVGITSTPVLDPVTGVLYVVAKGQEATGWVQRLHALDAATGAERPGSPVVITATVPGMGAGSVGGQVTFEPSTQLNRAGLLLRNGTVYMTFASHCDLAPYHGWILAYAYNGTQLQLARALNLTPDGEQGGIWQAGVGLSADADSIYFAAGNGSTNPFTTIPVVAEGVGRISMADFSQRDYWIPTSYVSLNNADSDLASGAILMPHNLLLTGSKDGRLYVLDSTNLGGYHADGDHIIQTIVTPGRAAGLQGHLHGGPIYYNIPAGGGEWFYMWPENSPVVGYRLDPASRTLGGLVQSGTSQPGHPGGMLTLSANAAIAGTGLVWALGPQGDAWHATVPGIVYALDASNISTVLWSSDQNAARDAVGNFGKFNMPVVINGRVYVPTFSNTLQVYGLLP